MASPAVREIAVRTLKKLSAVRDGSMRRLMLRDVEGASEREEARMATVMDLLGSGGRRLRF